MQWLSGKRRIEVPCTVEIEQTDAGPQALDGAGAHHGGGTAHHDPVAVGHGGGGVVGEGRIVMQWLSGKRRIEVPCTVEIEQTAESLHAQFEMARDAGPQALDGAGAHHGGGTAHHDPVAVGRIVMQWLSGKRRIEVPCTVEIEQTAESLHAHVGPMRRRRGSACRCPSG
jgi:hypothetical protein